MTVPRSRSSLVFVLGVVLGLVLTSTLVLRTTQAVFSGTTTTPTNSWTTGGAAITNDHTATAIYSTANDGTLTGGQVVQRCVVVTYNGNTTTGTSVKLYGTASTGLPSYLNLTIEQGSGTTGAVGSCTGFTASSTIYSSGTVAAFASADTNFATGAGSWSPSTTGATMTYRFTITVQNVAAAQNATATGTFTWEAQA
jgi:hypothetical protein